jgi:hypothetical protein
MQFNLSIILAAQATVHAATIPPPSAEKVNVTALDRAAASKAFSVSEWTDRGCSQNQDTWVLKDKKCYEPSSTSGSLEIWYLDPGCKRKSTTIPLRIDLGGG